MIMTAPSDRLLKTFRLRSTPSRQEILHLFLNKDYALSHGDIEKEINNELDRVTVYRTLKTFLDKGLIHACSKTGHHHDHVHFKCTSCGQTNCLEIEVPAVKLPKGYRASEVNLLIQGICERCSH
jgi:Fur family ferric uptake transcriptional regulator